VIQGIFASNQGIVGDRVGDFASAILQIAPTGSALMLALTAGMQKAGASDTVYNWFEDVHQPGRQGITGSVNTVVTTVPVTDGSNYVAGQILMVEETGEYLFVTAVSGNNLTVIRGMGGTTATSMTNVMHVQLIGNAHEEGSAMPTAVTQQGTHRVNYTQIFRNTWAVTETAKAVTFRTGNKVAKNKRDCALYHAEDMERSIMWGVKDVRTINGKPFRTTDGIKAQVINYGGLVVDCASGSTAGNYSKVDFEDAIRRIFSKNIKGQPNERIALGGDITLQVLNQMTALDGTNYYETGETQTGIAVTKIMTPFGTLKLMTHPLMNENPVWQKELYVLHPGAIRRRMLRETSDESYDTNGNRIQGVDAAQGVMTTEMGMEVGAGQTMGIIRNMAVARKSGT
jgi:hypothetical protein